MFAHRRRRRIGGWLVLCTAIAAALGVVTACNRAEPIAPADMLVAGAEVTGTQIIVKVFGPALY